MSERPIDSKEIQFAEAAQEWQSTLDGIDKKYGANDYEYVRAWDKAVRSHIETNLEPIEVLTNEDGMIYGCVYDADEARAIFGQPSHEHPNRPSDAGVSEQIHFREKR